MNKKKLLLLLSVALLLVGFFAFDLGQYLSLASFKAQQARIAAYYQAQPLRMVGIYFALYVAVTGLSLPGAAIMTLAAGAIFDLFWGTVIVSFASTIGATLAFLASRFLLRDAVQARFGDKLKAINAGIDKDGAFYLFILRLVPAFPFFVINLVMGLTPIRTPTFCWVSQLGMLAGTLVYVNAGTQIARIDSLAGILSPGLIASFTLLGVFPLLAKRLAEYAKARRGLRRFPRPKRFDRNLVVIGAGSAGLVAAYIASAVKAKVTLIERHNMGGDCLNTGCVPSKALLRSAKFLSHIKRAEEFGFRSAHADFDFAEIMQRVQRIVRTVEPHDSSERYTSLGVECIQGEARIVSPYTVQVNGRTLTTRGIVIAAGGRPSAPAIPGLEEVGYLTSDSVWALRRLPARLAVLGGGPIGCELAQAFARFGSRVTQIGPRLLPREDPEIGAMIKERFESEGIDVRLGHKAAECRIVNGQKTLICKREENGEEVAIEFDALLVAVGASPTPRAMG